MLLEVLLKKCCKHGYYTFVHNLRLSRSLVVLLPVCLRTGWSVPSLIDLITFFIILLFLYWFWTIYRPVSITFCSWSDAHFSYFLFVWNSMTFINFNKLFILMLLHIKYRTNNLVCKNRHIKYHTQCK